jgi:hypothetical protein
VPDETLEALILSIERLKRLVLASHVEIYLPPHFTAEMDTHVDPMYISVLEAAHSASLEELAETCSDNGQSMLSLGINSLRSFTCLKRFSIPEDLLVDDPCYAFLL